MTIELESMAVEMPKVKGHPNRVDFRGVLTLVDVPSEGVPGGAKGHRVLLTREAAERALPSLIGMAVDYAPRLDKHDAQRKVGIITHADVVGNDLEVGGYLYAKDFPEIVREVARHGRRPARNGLRSPVLRFQPKKPAALDEGQRLRGRLAAAVEEIRGMISASRRKQQSAAMTPIVLRAEAASSEGFGPGLGMSYELTKVNVLDLSARIWILTDVTFTGAAILRKNKAAYQNTWIALVGD